MKLVKLLKSLNSSIIGNDDIDVLSLCHNDKLCCDGSLFFCIKGTNVDGSKYVKNAVNNGAVCVVCEEIIDNLNVTQIIVNDARIAMSVIAKEFYDKPDEKLKMVAITGTNGKTTTVNMISQIINLSGRKVATIGTLGTFYNGEKIKDGLTTPDPIDLYKTLCDMVNNRIEYCIMEASAHAIALNKLYGLKINIVAITNITQDHLDFFGNMYNYANTKLDFIKNTNAFIKIVNYDDKAIRNSFKKVKKNVITYGLFYPVDVFAIDVNYSEEGTTFVVNIMDEIAIIKSPFYGVFNVYNLMLAMTVTRFLGFEIFRISKLISKLKAIDGRFNLLRYKNSNIIIDFAHTPDGLDNLLLQASRMGKEIVTIFGCGGNRDNTKRPIMGNIAEQYSKLVILTNDNPRYEAPDDIISDIYKGMTGKCDVIMLQSRIDAIEYAMKIYNNNTIVIAGKGAETYMEINGIKYDYNDKLIVQRFMEN